MIPIPTFITSSLFKYGLIAAIVTGVIFGSYQAGKNKVQAEWDLAKSEGKEKIVIQKVIEEKITEKIVTEYKDRIKVVKEKGDTIYVKVPEYITPADNANCTINSGFVRLYDNAIANTVPGPATESDRDPSRVSLSEVAANATINYTTCNLYRERALAWEKWAKEQKEARP